MSKSAAYNVRINSELRSVTNPGRYGIRLSFVCRFAKGSGTPSISKSVLENIEITIPDLLKQTSILELDKLQKAEKKLQKQILKLKQDYLNEQTYKALK